MLLEDQRSDVRQLADAVDDRELNVRIILRDLLDDRRLRETDADDQIVVAFGKRAHRRFDRVRSAGLDVAQDDRQIFRRRACTPSPRRGIERTIVLAADVEDDSDANLRLIFAPP